MIISDEEIISPAAEFLDDLDSYFSPLLRVFGASSHRIAFEERKKDVISLLFGKQDLLSECSEYCRVVYKLSDGVIYSSLSNYYYEEAVCGRRESLLSEQETLLRKYPGGFVREIMRGQCFVANLLERLLVSDESLEREEPVRELVDFLYAKKEPMYFVVGISPNILSMVYDLITAFSRYNSHTLRSGNPVVYEEKSDPTIFITLPFLACLLESKDRVVEYCMPGKEEGMQRGSHKNYVGIGSIHYRYDYLQEMREREDGYMSREGFVFSALIPDTMRSSSSQVDEEEEEGEAEAEETIGARALWGFMEDKFRNSGTSRKALNVVLSYTQTSASFFKGIFEHVILRGKYPEYWDFHHAILKKIEKEPLIVEHKEDREMMVAVRDDQKNFMRALSYMFRTSYFSFNVLMTFLLDNAEAIDYIVGYLLEGDNLTEARDFRLAMDMLIDVARFCIEVMNEEFPESRSDEDSGEESGENSSEESDGFDPNDDLCIIM